VGLERSGKGILLNVAEQWKGGRDSSSRAKATHEERMLIAVFKLGTSWMRQCLLRPEGKRGGSSRDLKCHKPAQEF